MAIDDLTLNGRWEASDLDAQAADSAVTSWPARDSGPVLAQATAAAQPVLRKSAVNGKSAVEFLGDDWLEGVLPNGSDVSFTRAIVVKVPNKNASEEFIWGGNRYYQEGHNFRRGGYGNSDYVGVHLGGTSYGWSAEVDDNWHVLTVVYDTATGAHQIYVDGTLSLDTTVSPPARTTDRFALGARLLQPGDGAEGFLQGHIAAVFNAPAVLSEADRSVLHTYVEDTYGIEVSDYGAGAGDTTPPTVPTLYSATPTGDQVYLTWSASQDAESGVAGFRLYRDITTGFTPSPTNLVDEVAALDYTDTGLADGTYYYVVTAYDNVGNESSPSNQVSAVVSSAPADTEPPSTPSGLMVAMVDDDNVVLIWEASTDNVGVSHYEVHRGDSAGFTPSVATLVDTSPTDGYNDLGVPNGTWYYKVIAVDAAENASAPSSAAEAVVDYTPPEDTEPPSVPTNLQASVDGSAVTLTWDPSTDNVGVVDYGVYRSSVPDFEATEDDLLDYVVPTTYLDEDVPDGTWYYRVDAWDAALNDSETTPAIQVVVDTSGPGPDPDPGNYQDEVLADGPLGCWPFQGDGLDVSGNGRDMEIVSAGFDSDPEDVGPWTSWLQLPSSGTNGFARTPSGPFSVVGPITFEFWMWIFSGYSGNEGYAQLIGLNDRVGVRRNANSSDQFTVPMRNSSNSDITNETGVTHPTGEWVHVVAMYDRPNLRKIIYLNGVEVLNQAANDYDLALVDNYLTVGAQYNGTSSAATPRRYLSNSRMAWVAVYDKALSPERVAAHYDAAFADPDPDPDPPSASVFASAVDGSPLLLLSWSGSEWV